MAAATNPFAAAGGAAAPAEVRLVLGDYAHSDDAYHVAKFVGLQKNQAENFDLSRLPPPVFLTRRERQRRPSLWADKKAAWEAKKRRRQQMRAMEKKVVGIGGKVVTLGGSSTVAQSKKNSHNSSNNRNNNSSNNNNNNTATNNNNVVKKTSHSGGSFFRVGQGGSVTYFDAQMKDRIDWKKKIPWDIVGGGRDAATGLPNVYEGHIDGAQRSHYCVLARVDAATYKVYPVADWYQFRKYVPPRHTASTEEAERAVRDARKRKAFASIHDVEKEALYDEADLLAHTAKKAAAAAAARLQSEVMDQRAYEQSALRAAERLDGARIDYDATFDDDSGGGELPAVLDELEEPDVEAMGENNSQMRQFGFTDDGDDEVLGTAAAQRLVAEAEVEGAGRAAKESRKAAQLTRAMHREELDSDEDSETRQRRLLEVFGIEAGGGGGGGEAGQSLLAMDEVVPPNYVPERIDALEVRRVLRSYGRVTVKAMYNTIFKKLLLEASAEAKAEFKRLLGEHADVSQDDMGRAVLTLKE